MLPLWLAFIGVVLVVATSLETGGEPAARLYRLSVRPRSPLHASFAARETGGEPDSSQPGRLTLPPALGQKGIVSLSRALSLSLSHLPSSFQAHTQPPPLLVPLSAGRVGMVCIVQVRFYA